MTLEKALKFKRILVTAAILFLLALSAGVCVTGCSTLSPSGDQGAVQVKSDKTNTSTTTAGGDIFNIDATTIVLIVTAVFAGQYIIGKTIWIISGKMMSVMKRTQK